MKYNGIYDKVVFVSKPRCASTAIFNYIYSWDDDSMGTKPLYHRSAKYMRSALDADWSNLVTFAVVRCPIQLVTSWYVHHKFGRPHKQTGKYYPSDINRWITDGCPTHWQVDGKNPLIQHVWTHEDNAQIVDCIIRLENPDWKEFEKKTGINMESLPISNASPKISTKNCVLSKESIGKIKNYFEKDFVLFGY